MFTYKCLHAQVSGRKRAFMLVAGTQKVPHGMGDRASCPVHAKTQQSSAGAQIEICNKRLWGFRGQCPLNGLGSCWSAKLPISSSASELDGWIICTSRLWKWRPSWRRAWLYFVLPLLWCLIHILVSALILYDFSYFISRQHTSLFRTRKRITLHFSTKVQHSSHVKQQNLYWKKSKFCKLLGGIIHV